MVRARYERSPHMAMPRDFQDRLELGDYVLCSCALRSTICAFKGKCRTSASIILFLGGGSVLWNLCCEDGRTLRTLAPHYHSEKLYLTSARFTLQSSKYASLKPSWVPTSSARLNLVLVRLPSSFSPPSNKSSQSLARPRS